MSNAYAVTLVDAAEIPTASRIEAERRCAASLERSLGGPEAVAAALQAWQVAIESAPEDLSADTMALAARWHRVADQARQDGMRTLGGIPGAHFDIRLPRGGGSA